MPEEIIHIDANAIRSGFLRSGFLIQPPPDKHINLNRLVELLNVLKDEDILQVEQELQAIIDKWIQKREG